MARSSGRHTVTIDPADAILRSAVPEPYDALANPASDDLIDAAQAMWPTGAAWGTPDGIAMSRTSVLSKLTRSILDLFLHLYRQAFRFAREATVSGVDALLPEWEADYGLPDPCETDEQTVPQRIKSLAAKVMSARVATPAEFVRFALEYGFQVAIEEPCIFECGFSECGGEHETGSAMEEIYFIVRIRDLQINYFTVGLSEVGFDPLFSYGNSAKLLCLIRAAAPAWTIPVLGDWRYLGEIDELPGTFVFGGSGNQLN